MAEAPRSALANTQMEDPPTRTLTWYDLPLTLDTVVRITGPFPLTPEEVERLQLLIYVMASGWTSEPADEAPAEVPDGPH